MYSFTRGDDDFDKHAMCFTCVTFAYVAFKFVNLIFLSHVQKANDPLEVDIYYKGLFEKKKYNHLHLSYIHGPS